MGPSSESALSGEPRIASSGVGADRQRRGDGQRPVVAERRQGERRERRRGDHHQQHFGVLGRFERGAGEQHQRQVDDGEAEQPHPDRGERASGEQDEERRGRATQARMLRPITGPRRCEITAIRAPRDSIAAGSTEPSVRIGCPDICDGIGDAEAFEDRRRDVGREDVAVRAGSCRR